MMCVTSLVTASKERQTGAKSCKAGKLHSAVEIISFTLDKCEYRSAASSFWNGSLVLYDGAIIGGGGTYSRRQLLAKATMAASRVAS
jgi:hypothetical protein